MSVFGFSGAPVGTLSGDLVSHTQGDLRSNQVPAFAKAEGTRLPGGSLDADTVAFV